MKRPIEGKEGWYKDDSGAVQSADKMKYEKFMKNYNAEIEKEKQFIALQTDCSELKSEMDEIKSLLKTLADKTVS